LNDLVQLVDAALASAVLRAGEHLACRPGCTQCCVGVFAISQQDAARLRDGLALLSANDAAAAERVRERAGASITRLAEGFPWDLATGLLRAGWEEEDGFEEFGNDEVCPALDPSTGTCDLYAHRPILCRTFGPPARTENGDLVTCELCFSTANMSEIAACEIDPSLPGLEFESNAAFDTAHGVNGETLVAFALRGA
jgi:Fe-S-cluster containining protein